MYAKRRGEGIRRFDAREQFDQMLKICEVIVNRCRREQKQGFVLGDVVKLSVVGTNLALVCIGQAAIAEMVRFINHNDISQFLYPPEAMGHIPVRKCKAVQPSVFRA